MQCEPKPAKLIVKDGWIICPVCNQNRKTIRITAVDGGTLGLIPPSEKNEKANCRPNRLGPGHPGNSHAHAPPHVRIAPLPENRCSPGLSDLHLTCTPPQKRQISTLSVNLPTLFKKAEIPQPLRCQRLQDFSLVTRRGFEPRTHCLKGSCSAD